MTESFNPVEKASSNCSETLTESPSLAAITARMSAGNAIRSMWFVFVANCSAKTSASKWNPQRCRDYAAVSVVLSDLRHVGAGGWRVCQAGLSLPQVSNAYLQLGLGDLKIGECPRVQLSLQTPTQYGEYLLGGRELPQASQSCCSRELNVH